LPLVFGSGQIEAVKFVISLIGALVHVLLLNAVIRANGWIRILDEKLFQLEQLDKDDPNGIRVFVFSDPDFAKKRNSLLASRVIFSIIGFGVIILWIEEVVRHYRLFYSLTIKLTMEGFV